ncbi:hypothetical protein ACFL35_12875 [Candidatus Riflebacteria bacterium]
MNFFKLKIRLWPLVFLLFPLFLLGCWEEDMSIAVYRVPKKKPVIKKNRMHGHGSMMGQMKRPGGKISAKQRKPELSWTRPAGWKEEPSSGIRVANFSITSTKGKGECYIVIMNMSPGMELTYLNMWRSEASLPPLKAPSNEMQQVKGEMGDYKWIKIQNPHKKDKALLMGIIPYAARTIFVKLRAPLEIIEENQSNFIQFCTSIRKKND